MGRGNQNESGDNSRDGSDANVSGDSGEHVRFDGGNPEDSGSSGEDIDESGSGGEDIDESGNAGRDDGTDSEGQRRIFHRTVTPEAEEANRSLLRLIANLERCEVTDLPPLYD